MRFRKQKPAQRAPMGNYAFIDSQNLNLGTQKMGWKMDWKKFREWLKAEYNVEKAFMFIGYMPDYEKLYDQLHSQGYLVVLKPTLEMFQTDEDRKEEEKKPPEEKKTVKGNIDADVVLHVMKELKNYDKAIIVSGDGDFYTLIEFLEQKGKLMHLMTPNWQYSSLLKAFEKYIIRLDQKRGELRYPDYRHKNRSGGQRSKPQQTAKR
jgi:uncharacterized LabA/DUF88 family protein